ncbi:MAG TPA: tetratricopeptide repeat protein [Anaerolineales bacterium]|nr:tetratricopeptide repeat protein [Anaerolineales bacterium]
MSENIVNVDEGSFQMEVLDRSHEVPVVVDFWAPWCGPCRVLGPLLERLTIEAGGAFRLAKVNVDENPNLAIRYGVRGIPAVKALSGGEVKGEFVGAQPEAAVRRFIERLVPNPTQQAVAEARSLLATRHWREAESSFRLVQQEDEANAPAALGLLQALLMQGKGTEALEILRDFPPSTEWASAEELRPLAQFLAEAEKADVVEDEASPLQASLHQAGRLIARGNLPGAMDGLIGILRQDKNYQNGLPRKVLLGIFALLGEDDPLTREYRDELASVLF